MPRRRPWQFSEQSSVRSRQENVPALAPAPAKYEASFAKPNLIRYAGCEKHFVDSITNSTLSQPTWGWAQRFINFVGSEDIQGLDDSAISDFLTKLVSGSNVAPATQRQAKSALMFLFPKVFGREVAFVEASRAIKATRLPVVFTTLSLIHI